MTEQANETPRTRHLKDDGNPKFTNELIHESSPYLRQHAHNPVNWLPWGKKAFERARSEDKPILLSVGYATCHWCHVMEEESFEDLEIAEYMNENYIPIKVDREQRPDVDAVYMNAVQMMTMHGGWPMTVFLTPDLEPFFGGTYFPPRDGDRGARMGFLTVLKKLKETYDQRREDVFKQANELAGVLRSQENRIQGKDFPKQSVLSSAYQYFSSQYDPVHGGFGPAPKFPRPSVFLFLYRYAANMNDTHAAKMVEDSLRHMARGGIYDQIGGGFHRYSTDHLWLVPHFEKMLYDNAQLAVVYLEAFQKTGDEEFRSIVQEILDYVVREMRSPRGGFYSATDADSEGEEGKFFVWQADEVLEILGEKEGRLFCDFFDVTEAGNFEGNNVLHRPVSVAEFAGEKGIGVEELRTRLDQSRKKLYEARQRRPMPLTDDKILTGWNGLMISAFSRAAFVLRRSDYLNVAVAAAENILQDLCIEGSLMRCHHRSKGIPAFLDDYSFFIAGLLDLFEASQKLDYLKEAIRLQETLNSDFWDPQGKAYFMAGKSHEKLITRDKPFYDGAEPSGNSVAIMNLLRLGVIGSKPEYIEMARKALSCFSAMLEQMPYVAPQMLQALDWLYSQPKEVALVAESYSGDPARFICEEDQEILDCFRSFFVPHRVFAFSSPNLKDLENRMALMPWLKEKPPLGSGVSAYVCIEGACSLPTQDPKVFEANLAGKEVL